MSRIIIVAAFILSGATAAVAQQECLAEQDVLDYVKQQGMVETRCYWNTHTARSEEEFQCVRTWVSPTNTYFSVESRLDCLVNPRTHSQAEMKKLLRVKRPEPPCDDCG